MAIIAEKKIQVQLNHSVGMNTPEIFSDFSKVCKEKLNIIIKVHSIDEIHTMQCFIKNDDEKYKIQFPLYGRNNDEVNAIFNYVSDILPNKIFTFEEIDQFFHVSDTMPELFVHRC